MRSPKKHGDLRGIPADTDMRLRWSDRGGTANAGSSGSPFPLPTRLADGLGARKSPGSRYRDPLPRCATNAHPTVANTMETWVPRAVRQGSGGGLGVRIQRTRRTCVPASGAQDFQLRRLRNSR